jgi:hypothetical protein
MGKSKKKQSSETHSTGSFRKYEAIIFPLIIIALIGYFIVTKANGDDTIDENYLVGSIVFFMALMFISIPKSSPGGSTRKRAPPKRKTAPGKKGPGAKKAPPKGRSSIIEEIEEESVTKERKIISYPGAASGGKYGDAYIPISQEMILKVRSLLAVSCRNCKDLDTCWEKYKDEMDYDSFLESTECHEKMDPAVISAAPPVQITEEGPGEEPVVEEVAIEEEVAIGEGSDVGDVEVESEDTDGEESGDDWGDDDFDTDGDYEGDEEEYSDEDDDSSWE